MALTTLSFFLSDPVADALGSGLEFLRKLFRTPPGSGQLQDLLAVFCRIGGMGFGHFLYSFPQAYHYPPKRVNSTTACVGGLWETDAPKGTCSEPPFPL